MRWIRDILDDCPADVEDARCEHHKIPFEVKEWTQIIAPTNKYTLFGPTEAALGLFLTPEGDDDAVRLMSQHEDINDLEDVMASKADTAGSWRIQVTQATRLAFQSHPEIHERAETGALIPNTSDRLADHYFSFTHRNAEHCIAVGLMKPYGSIVAEEWISKSFSKESEQLSKELRGFAHDYGSPQVYCYDGAHLLLMQFRASDRDHILESSCLIEVMLLPRLASPCQEDGECSMRYALYRLLAQGIRRCIGQCAPPLIIGGYSRVFTYYSGVPVFVTQGHRPFMAYPPRCHRKYDSTAGAWFWSFEDQLGIIWDTEPLTSPSLRP